jgi:hypoxanthine-guanine phosphoribosyltransferase
VLTQSLACVAACTDLAREVSKEIPNVKVDFMKASSYGAASESSGDVTVKGASTLAKWDNYNILLVSCSFCWCAALQGHALVAQ